ncbi:hypothetical protein SCP_0300410 [Sparassis crispa]|uniref:Uncharacterized protein n=1 Tax=Sparassis crispa TaxID=139825 RepID=A0A401GDS3_9APHY|nr:hypothetical protein SCP_0300410 [Sparassis crispa]GBE80326.1 hypothetical protein SCP_0300410 [Sparassis crispa]
MMQKSEQLASTSHWTRWIFEWVSWSGRRTSKTAVIALYPGVEDDHRNMQSDLTQIVWAARTRGVSSHVEEGQYYQDFTHVTLFLLFRGRLSAYEWDRLYLEGFEASSLHAIKNRLVIKVPDQNPDNLYMISEVHSAAQHVLSGSESALSTVAVSKPSAETVKLEGNETDAMQFLVNVLQQAMRTSGGGQAPIMQANIQVAVAQNPLQQALHACNFCLAIDHFMQNCPRIKNYIRVWKINCDALSRIILPNGQFVPHDLPGHSMAERIDAWHDMYPGNLFGDGPGPSAAPPPNVSRDGRDQPLHMVSIWEIVKEALNPKKPSSAYIEECLDDSAASVLEASMALKKKTVQFDDSTAGKSAKHPPSVPASQIPASILKLASDPSVTLKGGAKASFASSGNWAMQYSYKTPVEDKELMALCSEIRKLEKEEITVKRVATMGSFEGADGEEVAEALLVDWAHPSSYTLGGGPTAQKYPYGGGPTAQNNIYDSGPTAQKYPYGGGPTAQNITYGGGPTAQKCPYGGGPIAQNNIYDSGPTAQKYPYGGGPTAQNITYGSGPTAQNITYGGGPTAQKCPYGGGPIAQNNIYDSGPTAQKYPYGGGPTAQNITYGGGPTAQKCLYGGGPITK